LVICATEDERDRVAAQLETAPPAPDALREALTALLQKRRNDLENVEHMSMFRRGRLDELGWFARQVEMLWKAPQPYGPSARTTGSGSPTGCSVCDETRAAGPSLHADGGSLMRARDTWTRTILPIALVVLGILLAFYSTRGLTVENARGLLALDVGNE
jgi:hypothetical protein